VLLQGGAVVLSLASPAVAGDLRSDFQKSPLEYRSRSLWFWNAPLDAAKTQAMMTAAKESGYAGLGILPSPGMTPAYFSEEYFAQYGAAISKAAELGQKLTLYDEFWFPSGGVGGLLAKKYPDALLKRLDMLAEDVQGPKPYEKRLPAGRLMAVVAMHNATKDRRDLSGEVREGVLRWSIPAGNWKVMIFTCVQDGARGLVVLFQRIPAKKMPAKGIIKYACAVCR
jgi:hypothetical protein